MDSGAPGIRDVRGAGAPEGTRGLLLKTAVNDEHIEHFKSVIKTATEVNCVESSALTPCGGMNDLPLTFLIPVATITASARGGPI